MVCCCHASIPRKGSGYQQQQRRSRTLARKGGSEREHEEEGLDSAVKEGKFQGREGGQARRASLREVGESMRG